MDVRVAVVGLGYVGLVTAGGLAEWGHEVVGVEVDPRRFATLLAGRVPLHEPGLDELVARHLAGGSLHFTSEASGAVGAAHLTLVAVGTTDNDGGWQNATLLACLGDIVPHLADDSVLVIRSTVPPTFIPQLVSVVGSLREAAGRPPVAVLLNPEFTREGTAVHDFLEPDRVVVGLASDADGHGLALARRLYRQVEAPIVVLTANEASLAKLGANLFLATKISFANELAALCDAFGATVDHVVSAMAYDPRIGGSFLRSGIGFGGSCLPHQVRATVRTAGAAGVPTPLLSAVDEINHRQRTAFVERIAELVGGRIAGLRVALLGLTFKPHTDDLREAPSLAIAQLMLDAEASVVAYDPMEQAGRRAAVLVPGLEIAGSAEEALAGADAAGLMTEWPEFTAIDWVAAANSMRRPVVVDGRNALSPSVLVAAGFTYSAFGRGRLEPVVEEPSLVPGSPGGIALVGAGRAVVGLAPSAVTVGMDG